MSGFAIGVVVGVGLAAALVVGWLARRERDRRARVRELTRAIERIAAGEQSELEVDAGDDDLAALAGAVHALHRALRAAMEQRNVAAQSSEGRADKLMRLVVELDQLTYATSHDLRAPLQAIDQLLGFVTEDLREADISDETREHLALLNGRVKRMHGFLNGITQLSRAGRTDEPIDDVQLAALVREIARDLTVPPGFEVTTEGDLGMETAVIPLRQVLRLLIDNALTHHDRDHGRVVVSHQNHDRHFFAITVTDDGPGIPAKHHTTAFRMFRTLERRDVKETTGIGLALVKKRVESVDGRVTIESEGRGTAVRFTWPKEWPTESTAVRFFAASRDSRMQR